MVSIILAFVLALAMAQPLRAAEYYVAKTGSNTNCSTIQNPSTPALTLTFALGCKSAGDTINAAAGVYAETGLGALFTSGLSEAQRTTLKGAGRDLTIIRPTTSGQAVLLTGKSYIEFNGLTIDGQNAGNNPLKLEGGSHYVLLDNVRLTGGNASGLLCVNGDFGIMRNSRSDNNGDPATQLDHGVYNSTNCDDWVFDRNELDHNTTFGIQIYAQPKRATFTNNYVHDNCQKTAPGGTEMIVSHQDHIIEGNLIVVTGGDSCQQSMSINLQVPARTKATNNTIICTGTCTGDGIAVNSTAVDTEVANNLIAGSFVEGIDNDSGSTTLTTNRVSSSLAGLFTNAAELDFSLAAGSAAIDAGTDFGSGVCGASRDQGAFETLVPTGGSIDGHTMDLTICTKAAPIQVFTNTSGWSVGCSGPGCGTPSVSAVTVVTGSSSVVRLTIAGITGDACQVGQTWTISYDANLGLVTDSAHIGGIFDQPLHTFGPFSITNDCSGGSGGAQSYPGTPYIWYKFDGNANDSSSNNHLHGIENGISYVTGKYGQAMRTDDGQNDYVEVPFLIGVNPSVGKYNFAVGVYIDPAELGKTRDIMGTALGVNQRFHVFRHNSNNWRMAIQDNQGTSTEFTVDPGWTHICVKFDGDVDAATLYINGVPGTVDEGSRHAYTSYTFASNLRIGLPSGFATSLSGKHDYDDFLIYTGAGESCEDIYAAWEPPTVVTTVVQAAHQWQGVHLHDGSVKSYNAQDANIDVVQGGAVALMVQLNCTGGACTTLSPRFRYSLNGSTFLPVPGVASSDGLYWWGNTTPGLNFGLADGPITGALTHTDGPTLLTPTSGPTFAMSNNTSYTLRGIFRFLDTATIGNQYCFKIYDQSGGELVTTPSGGACATIVPPQGSAF